MAGNNKGFRMNRSKFFCILIIPMLAVLIGCSADNTDATGGMTDKAPGNSASDKARPASTDDEGSAEGHTAADGESPPEDDNGISNQGGEDEQATGEPKEDEIVSTEDIRSLNSELEGLLNEMEASEESVGFEPDIS